VGATFRCGHPKTPENTYGPYKYVSKRLGKEHIHDYCRQCSNERNKQRYLNPEIRKKMIDNSLKHYYGNKVAWCMYVQLRKLMKKDGCL